MPITKPREIKVERIKHGFSMRSLANAAGLNGATISKAEKRPIEVSPRTAKAILDVLGVPFDQLFSIEITKEGA